MNKIVLSACAALILLCQPGTLRAEEPMGIYAMTVNDIDGKPVSLNDYKGKTLLIVNTASRCGYTPQYKTLEALYEKYKDRGFAILGFPANNFGGQEPGTNAEIKDFCFRKFNVTFPMFGKISVAGDDMHPLYKLLTEDKTFGGAISWNFNKFLIDKNGNIIARYPSKVDPLSPELVGKLESVL